MIFSGIYKISSTLKPERFYIGSAINLRTRKNIHFHDLRTGRHHSAKFQNHFNKYGESDLTFSVIEPCLPDFLLIREQYYIESLSPYFNICKKAGSCLGVRHSEETKAKLSEIHRGMKGPMKGRHHTKETKQLISDKKKGSKGYWTGKKRDPDTIERARLKKIGQIPWNKGRTGVYSEETINKIKEARKRQKQWNKGCKDAYSNEAKEKMRQAKLGHKQSEETKAKKLATFKRTIELRKQNKAA